jgi:hypothetical protein
VFVDVDVAGGEAGEHAAGGVHAGLGGQGEFDALAADG